MDFRDDAQSLRAALVDERSGIARRHRQTGSSKLKIESVERFITIQSGIDAIDAALPTDDGSHGLGKINADDH